MRNDKYFTYIEKHSVAQGIATILQILGALWIMPIGPIVLDEMGFVGTDMFMLPWIGNGILYIGLGWIIEHIFSEKYRGELITDFFSVYEDDEGYRVEVNGREVKWDILVKKQIPSYIRNRNHKIRGISVFKLPDGNNIYIWGKDEIESIIFLNDTIIMENDRIYYDRIDKVYGVMQATPVMQQNVQTPVIIEKAQATANEGLGLTTPIVAQKKNDAYILIALEGQFAGQNWELDKSIMLGRDANCCQIVFAADTAGVSRVHCEVGCKDGFLYIRDLGSSYGTTLEDGQVVNNYQEVKLESSDTFRVSANDKFMVMKN